jgi:hypothetical protein
LIKENEEQFENIVLELFDPKYNEVGNRYLPDHPVFIKFKDLLGNGIKRFNDNYASSSITIINLPLFLTEFNSNLLINLEEEKLNDKDLRTLLRKWKVNCDFQKMLQYLKNARNLFFETNTIDQKSLSDYYIENKAYVVDKKTWDYEEKDIQKSKEWNMDSLKWQDPNSNYCSPIWNRKVFSSKKNVA